MTKELKNEDYLIQIRDKLRKEGIKLWLQPYYTESNGPSVEDLKKLCGELCSSLNLPYDVCYETVIELQNNSIENFKLKNRFEESGLASIKIKILHQGNAPRLLIKELTLNMMGLDLRRFVAKELTIQDDRVKLISNGKVLSDADSLNNQGVKNGQQVLAVILSEAPSEVQERENRLKELENVKTDSQLLALDDHYMQLEDQFGNPINIGKNEKKALIVAMTLHEKGRTALKRNDYTRALVFFLEADEEFRHCNSQLLKSVDNYALLDLDIAWCYLCLQSFTHLPEAQERLMRCENRLEQTYGRNLERLIAVKGTPGNEAALFMRLHLLQAVVLYHQNKRIEALQLLQQAERELQALKVDEGSITALVELGYSVAEARLGLRATNGDVNNAANYINENREKRAECRRKAKAEEILMKEKKKLGKCADGKQYVEPNFLNILVNMGFNMEAARIALQKCNNVISESIQYIEEHPLPGPSQSKSQEFNTLIEDLVPELVEVGFDPRMAKIALQKHNGDITKAAEELLTNNGIVLGDLSKFDINSESVDEIKRKVEEKRKEKEDAFKRIAEDISAVEDDHLDLNLEQEELFLIQYLSLLQK